MSEDHRKILQNKGNINMRNKKSETPLSTVMTKNYFQLGEVIVRKKRSIDNNNNDLADDTFDTMDSLIENGGTYSGKCYCQNGSAGEAEACPAEGDQFCSSCDNGYQLFVKEMVYANFTKKRDL